MKRASIWAFVAAMALQSSGKEGSAYEGGGEIESELRAARAIVLTEVRKDWKGQLALFVLKTLKGHPVQMLTLGRVPSDVTLGTRFVLILDDDLSLPALSYSHGPGRTAKIVDGIVQAGSDRELYVDFEKRMAALNREQKPFIDAMEACLEDPAGSCSGLTEERRRCIRRRETLQLLQEQLAQAAVRCNHDVYEKGQLRANIVIDSDGKANVRSVNNEKSTFKNQACIKQNFEELRIRFWKDPEYAFHVMTFKELWAIQMQKDSCWR